MVGDPLPSLEAVQSIGSGYLLFAGTVYAYLPLFPSRLAFNQQENNCNKCTSSSDSSSHNNSNSIVNYCLTIYQ